MQTACPAEELWTNVAGVRMFARAWRCATGGDGRPIVLVHGIAVSSRYMVPTAERLADDFRVYAPDLPGFGRSGKPRTVLTIEQLADALGTWLDLNAIERPLLVGNSNGCQVIADLAARPHRVFAGLVLDSPTVDIGHRAVIPEILRLLADAPRERPSLVALNVRDYVRAGFRRAIGTLRSAIEDRIEDKLPRITAPVVIVRGSRDPIVSDQWVRVLAAHRAGTRVVTLDGVPHAANYSAPDAFAPIVAELASR